MTKITPDDRTMIESCFTYGYTSLKNPFLSPIVERCGKRQVQKIIRELERDYTVVFNVYTDREGTSYNRLVKREA